MSFCILSFIVFIIFVLNSYNSIFVSFGFSLFKVIAISSDLFKISKILTLYLRDKRAPSIIASPPLFPFPTKIEIPAIKFISREFSKCLTMDFAAFFIIFFSEIPDANACFSRSNISFEFTTFIIFTRQLRMLQHNSLND